MCNINKKNYLFEKDKKGTKCMYAPMKKELLCLTLQKM